MIIVFVIDNYGALTNGTTITAYRFREELIKRGHTVRVVGVGLKGEDMYSVKENYIPIVTPVSHKQNMYFGKPDKKVLQEAFNGADVIHFYTQWKLARVGKRIADKMGIPSTAAFHTQPENITYGAGIGRFGNWIAWLLYRKFRKFYQKFENIHCPSVFIAEELKKHHYNAKLHVISNGIGDAFHKLNIEKKKDDKFRILMIGRFSLEKRQDLIIKAVKQSKYEKNIQIYFAGAGPREKKLRKLAKSLTNQPIFGFYKQNELINLINQMDLYIHAADVEIEVISCLEAIACGQVPVIANAKKSATKQFALDKRCLFKEGNVVDLKDKIEYWIEHQDEKELMSKEYIASSNIYRLDYSIDKAEEMFNEAIRDLQNNRCRLEVKNYHKKIKKNKFQRGLSFLIYYGLAVPVLWLYQKLFLNLRIKNRRYIRKVRRGGAVTICNHVHTLDGAMSSIASFPKKPIFTSIPENFENKFGFLVNILGAIPIPRTVKENRLFFYQLSKELRNGRFVHFYPEGELVINDQNLRAFKRGAFHLAVDAQVPILPMAIKFKERKRKLLRKNYIELTVGKPIYPNRYYLKKDAVDLLFNQSVEAMQKLMKESA